MGGAIVSSALGRVMRPPPRVPLDELREGPRELDIQQTTCLVRVLRLRVGDKFVAFDPKNILEADACVERDDGVNARIVIGEPRRSLIAPRSDVVWVQGLAKGEKGDAIVR